MPSRSSGATAVVTNTTVSPYQTMTAPFACLATSPTSRINFLPAICFSTRCSMDSSPPYRCPQVKRLGQMGHQVSLRPSATAGPSRLSPQAEPFDQRGVAGELGRPQIIEQTPALADKLQQPPPRMMVFPVGLQMLSQVADPFAQDRHLHLRRSTIPFMAAKFLDHRPLTLCREWHPRRLLST